MQLRPAGPDDAPALARLSGEFGYSDQLAPLRERLELLLDSPDQTIWLAEEDGAVLGWMNARVNYQLESPPHAEITGLVVTARRRSQGIGAALVAQAERWAREHGLNELRVRSRLERPRAHAFYQRQGYAELKTQHCFVRQLPKTDEAGRAATSG